MSRGVCCPHSELVLVRDHGQYKLLGCTRDDAAGEAFDKVARILGLKILVGLLIQQAAQRLKELAEQQKNLVPGSYCLSLTTSWLRGTYDFSFSGLKTHYVAPCRGGTGAGAKGMAWGPACVRPRALR